MIVRPEHLPDFGSPPLDEVVVGVQFASPKHYSSVHAKDVWGLFKETYPKIQEHPPLEPSFETFGGSSAQPSLKFKFGPAPLHSRLWFISEQENHLIQFQNDRFLLNWRKRSKDQDYPRFESIAESFNNHLDLLQGYFQASLGSQLDINQAEVSYINTVPLDNYSRAREWFCFFGLRGIELEGANVNFTEIINDSEGKPYARLTYELQTVITIDGKVKAFRFALTFRGKPAGNNISDAMNFVFAGREKIVTRFKELTTEQAHKSWEIVI